MTILVEGAFPMNIYTEMPPSQMCGIYIIKNIINNKVYIGQSVDIYHRWIQHKADLRNEHHHNEHLQRAWNKYGEKNFEFAVLIECSESELNSLEKSFIVDYKSNDGHYGYNLTIGGDGCIGLSQESIEKMRQSLTGRRLSEDTRRKIGESNKGKKLPPRSEDHKHNLGNSLKGKNAWNKGVVMSDDFKEKMCGDKNPNHRSIYCIELDEYFGSIREAEKKYGFNHSGISACLNGKQESSGKHPVTGEKLHWKDCKGSD
jgi:group I intron endonuclease